MKKLLVILVLFCSRVNAQTQIPSTTTIATLKTMPAGNYYFVVGTDTSYYSPCTAILTIRHDTIPRVCPPPIICPPPIVCPPPPKQRTATGITWDIILNKKVITYDDKTTTTL